MASKSALVAGKRKSGPSGKALTHGPAKKQKLETRKAKKPKEVVEEVWSDEDDEEEDGGAPLEEDNVSADAMEIDEELPQNAPKTAGDTAASGNGATSRERHEEQRRVARERKLAKPFGEQLHRLKKIWERLRRKSHVPKEERTTLVKELFDISTGHFKELVTKHDSVRVVQTALKYSSPIQRKEIAKELSGLYTMLASNKYSKFLIDKLLGYSDDEIRDLIIPEFYGKVRKLMLNPEASWVLDDIYRKVATKEQKATILREWYGPEFALFRDTSGKTPTADLTKILEEEPNKRGPIMKSLMGLINPMLSKGWSAFTSLHDAMLQYFKTLKAGSEEHRQFMDLCINDESGDLIKHLGFTDSGSRLACLLLAHGTAKDRKLIIRALKDAVQMMSIDMYGHVVILAAYEVVDDTVLLSKSVVAQIVAPESEDNKHETVCLAANDLYARTTLLYLFEGASKALFPTGLARDLEILNEVTKIRQQTSRKDPEVRRIELIEAASKPLLGAIADMPIDLVTTSFGCQFVTDVLLSATGDKEAAVKAVAAAAAGDLGDPLHLSHVPFTGRMFKMLVQGGRYDKEQGKIVTVLPPLKFADALYEHIKGQEVEWATGPSSFVILSMLESDDFSDKKALVKKLNKNRSALEKVATEETTEQKARREGEEQEDGNDRKTGKGKKGKGKGKTADRPVGNIGTSLILEKVG